MSNTNDLKQLIVDGESVTLEFKSSFDREVIETLTAFANARGGSVLIGVTDSGEVRGIDLGKESLQDWLNRIKLNTTPSLFPDLEEISSEGITVVRISISEHPIKPVSCKGKYFRRMNNSNHQMSITEISDLHLKTFNTSWDYYLDTRHKLEDISLEKVNRFIEKANSIRPYPIDDDPMTVLKKYELVKDEKITHGCWLLFTAKESPVGTIEAGRFSGETVIKDSLTIRTDLISEVDLLLDFIRKHISRGYVITGEAQRRERWDYPLDALREIVVNMVAHRDYMHAGDSIVKIFDERIEFFNPGRLPQGITVENLIAGNYTSAIRNKQIALIFKEVGLVEKYGSGIKRIIKAFNEDGLPMPCFEEFQHGFRVTVFKTPQKTLQKTPQKTPQRESLSDRIIQLIVEEPHITQKEAGERLGISFDTAREYFARLKKSGRLKRVGGRRTGYWQVTDQM